jgi:DNA-binding Lrp family transcriptional regulator
MASLDSIDRRLLAELQAEGRVTNVELAQRVGLTAPPCLRRVRALEEAGVIKGYHAELDASKLGFAITVFAIWAKDGFCDVGCPDENLNWLFTGLNVAAVGAYALTVIIGARWVMRGLREQRHGED